MLNAAAVGLSLPRPGLPGSADGDAAVERALASGHGRLRFEPPLEARYEKDTGRGRTARHIACNFVGIGSFWVMTGTDQALFPEIGGTLSLLRSALVVVLLLGNLAIIELGQRSLGGWRRETITSAGTLLVAGYVLFFAHHVGSTSLVMRLSGLMSIFLHTGIAARLRFPFALAINVIVYVAYAALAGADGAQAREVVANHLLLLGCTVVLCSAGNYLLEYRERRSYLLRRLEAARDRALRADAKALRRAAARDGLTQIYNRRHFDAELARHWDVALQQGGAVTVLQVDVDHFKAYNDHYGHLAGDHCLIQVAKALDAVATAGGGIAARVGGEEFALLLPVVRAADPRRRAAGRHGAGSVDLATQVCERIRALAIPHLGSDCAAQVTVSVGAAVVAAGADLAPSACVAAADTALYAAKTQGRNRAVRFEGRPRSVPRGPQAPGDVSREPHTVAVGEPAARVGAPDPQEALIEALSAQLRKRSARLRFPGALEDAFQNQGDAARRRNLTRLLVPCLAVVVGYVWLSAPVLGDIAGLLLRRVAVLCAVMSIAVMVVLRRPCGWRWREGVVSAVIGVLGLCIVATEALGSAPTVYTATVGVCLLPMFASLVAAQPFGFCLAPSLLICIGVGWMMDPGPGERQAIWLFTFGVICTTTLYSLLGGYLLERARRRTYLLRRLRAAQLVVLQRNTEMFHRLARLDPLTGLPNRRHFDAELDRFVTLGTALPQPLGLLIVDIDYFKRYNDAHGHPAGDECLRRIGDALADWAERAVRHRPPDHRAGSPLVARLGGEEFGVLLPGSDGAAALATAGQVCALLAGLGVAHPGSSVAAVMTASVGAASGVLRCAPDARLLLAAADAALYRAKARGRNQAAD